MKNFKVEAEGAEFEFFTMNIKRLQAFQVYTTHNGEQIRFHMQLNNETGDFYITDKARCPAEFHQAEDLLNKAIKIYGVED
jgi:hypothetical protein